MLNVSRTAVTAAFLGTGLALLLSACASPGVSIDAAQLVASEHLTTMVCHNHADYQYAAVYLRFNSAGNVVALRQDPVSDPSYLPYLAYSYDQNYSIMDQGNDLAWRAADARNASDPPESVAFYPGTMELWFAQYRQQARMVWGHKDCQWFQGCQWIPNHYVGGYVHYRYDCNAVQ